MLMWYLAQSPNVARRLAKEQRELVAAHGPDISWEVLEGMEYAK